MVLRRLFTVILLLGLCATAPNGTHAQADAVTEVCPGIGLQARPESFSPGGILLSTWDRSDLWAYEIRRNARYPLENTAPCGTNCHLSLDGETITYHDAAEGAFGQMRLDGSGRVMLATNATEIEWWSAAHVLVWTGSHSAYLLSLADGTTEDLTVHGLVSVQPGGYRGLTVDYDADAGQFTRRLVDLHATETDIALGVDERYFDAAVWSPDGAWLAYVRAEQGGGVLMGFQPGTGEMIQWTDFDALYGKVRIGGLSPVSLSWSPDSRFVAFWVTPILAANPEITRGESRLHILDTETGIIRVYCDVTTEINTPNPPRLAWSPDGSAIAFGAEDALDDEGTMLIALTVETGIFTALSADVVPALGAPDVIAWGN